ncbi:MAG: hypothetical protein R3310_03790 [Candidatus Competibacteraceae bacterium]|nr:hypothetical protein [Candidatus Competibacteraceae bacterium]
MQLKVHTESKTYSGRPAECLAAMSKDRWYTGQRSVDWMGDVASKARRETGKPVRVDTALTFLEDLAGAGLVRLEKS